MRVTEHLACQMYAALYAEYQYNISNITLNFRQMLPPIYLKKKIVTQIDVNPNV